jgi:hypothetical protein
LPINEGFEKNNNNSCFFLNASAANRNTDVWYFDKTHIGSINVFQIKRLVLYLCLNCSFLAIFTAYKRYSALVLAYWCLHKLWKSFCLIM